MPVAEAFQRHTGSWKVSPPLQTRANEYELEQTTVPLQAPASLSLWAWRGDADRKAPRQPEDAKVERNEYHEPGVRGGNVLDGKAYSDGNRLSQHQCYEIDDQQAHVAAPLRVNQQGARSLDDQQAERDDRSRLRSLT